jgi:hypothetical protein
MYCFNILIENSQTHNFKVKQGFRNYFLLNSIYLSQMGKIILHKFKPNKYSRSDVRQQRNKIR